MSGEPTGEAPPVGIGDGGPISDGGDGEPGRARQLFRYLGGEEWQEYRAILGVFAGTFFAEFTAEDVAADPDVAGSRVNADMVAGRLESLRRWGNLTVSSSVGAPASLEDYYRRRNRYLITRASQEVYELVEGVLAGVDEIGDVQAGRLRDLHRTLDELAAQLEAGATGEAVADQLRRIFDLHERFTSELTQFFAELNQWQNRYDLDATEVQLFATVLVGYVSEKLSEIERMTRPIARSLDAILDRLDDLLGSCGGLAARVDDAGLGANVSVRRLKGTDRADWEHLAAWFRPPPGRVSRLDQLTRQAVAAVRTLTANVTRLSRAGLGAASRRADFARLAGFFDRATSADEAHRIAAAAFGLGSCRRIGALGSDADDPVPSVTPWREAPPATVAVSLRVRGDRSQRGTATPLRDRRRERVLIAQRRERERVTREAVAAELLGCAGAAGLLDGAQLSVVSFALLRDLLGRSGHGDSSGAAVRAATADGVRCEVRRIAGARTAVECPDGRLVLRGLELAVSAAPGAREAGLDVASATGVAT